MKYITLEEGTISVFLSLREITERGNLFINVLRNGTFYTNLLFKQSVKSYIF